MISQIARQFALIASEKIYKKAQNCTKKRPENCMWLNKKIAHKIALHKNYTKITQKIAQQNSQKLKIAHKSAHNCTRNHTQFYNG
jgi:hypothetical protein